MVVKNSIVSAFLILCLAIIFISCNQTGRIREILKQDSISQFPSFIDTKYFKEDPIAEIINLPDYTDSTQSFELASDQDVQIYAIGELVYQLANADRAYYFRGDDIELSFIVTERNGKKYALNRTISFAQGEIDTAGKVHFVDNGIELFGKITNPKKENGKYLAEVRIPFSLLHASNNARISFNAIIGDDDDHYKQESRMALFTSTEFNQHRLIDSGNLFINAKRKNEDEPSSLFAGIHKIAIDGKFDDWYLVKDYCISKAVYGSENIWDKFDFSGTIKLASDKSNLYICFEIFDSKLNPSKPDTESKNRTFADYASIFDSSGKEVWTMHAYDSKYAGGALKNQKIATILHLKKGIYKVSYTSDECHSFNKWEAEPPQTPFYGVVLYKKKK